MVKTKIYNRGNFAAHKCPKDCPFRDKMGSGLIYCSFAIYADKLEPGRHTRTEITVDGEPDYHFPPDCDIYDKYKDQTDRIREMKRIYDQYGLMRYSKYENPDLVVTGKKHMPKSKHRGDF